MSIADLEVTQARAALDRAEATQRNEKRKALVEQLKQVRAELREAHRTYRRLASQIKSEDALRARLQAELLVALSAVSESLSLRPQAADYLENDEEVVAWRKRHTALEAERDRLFTLRDAVPRSSRETAAGFEGGNGKIALLEQAEKNLLAALDGSLGKFGEGSISPV